MMEFKNSGVVEESESALNVLMEAVQMKSELNKGQIMQHKVLQVVNSKSFQLFIERDWKFGDFAGFRAKSLSNTWMERDRWALIEKQIYAFAESLEDEAEDCLKEAVQERVIMFRVNDIHATDIFLGEIEIYDRFTSKCYKGGKIRLELCEEREKRIVNLVTKLKSFDGEQKRGEIVHLSIEENLSSSVFFNKKHENIIKVFDPGGCKRR